MSKPEHVCWIVAVYPVDNPAKVTQIGIYKYKRDAQRRARRYVPVDGMEVVVMEAWMQRVH